MTSIAIMTLCFFLGWALMAYGFRMLVLVTDEEDSRGASLGSNFKKSVGWGYLITGAMFWGVFVVAVILTAVGVLV